MLKLPGTLILTLMAGVTALFADSVPTSPSEVLDRYLAASQAQQERLRGISMEVEIDAKLLRLKKTGTLHALRSVSRLGRITYDALRFAGDKTIKNDVIARYLTAETQVQAPNVQSLSISPANYKFKYKGLTERERRLVHVFQVTPKKKRVGLFKGELWVDSDTFLPVRESGRLVKNPSVFLKRVEFVREYEIRDGASYPTRIESVIDTRIVGRAELHVQFSNIAPIEEHAQIAGGDLADSQ